MLKKLETLQSNDHDLLIEHTIQIENINNAVTRTETKIDKLTDLLIDAMEKKVDTTFLQWFIGVAIILSIFISGILITNVEQTNCNAKEIAIIKTKEAKHDNSY